GAATGANCSTGDSGASATTGASTTGGTSVTINLPPLVTSGPGAYWKTGMPTTVTTGNADLTVNDTTTYQTWDGFGGAFNEMGWDDLSVLSASDRDRAMSLLFGSDGARFIFGRIPIGASDYAVDRYTDDETPNDYTMAKFSITRDQQRIIPYVKAALAQNANLRLWASPWTPPTWMKDNAAFNGGNMKDDAQILQALALYLAKWVQAYAT